MREMSRGKKAYIVQRLYWEYNDSWWDVHGEDTVRAFELWEGAELLRMDLEEEARRASLFDRRGRPSRTPAEHAGGLGRATSLGEEEVIARLRGWRLALPPEDENGGLRWDDLPWWSALLALVEDTSAPAYWERLDDPTLGDDDKAQASRVGPDDIWALFDRVRFCEVIEIELEES